MRLNPSKGVLAFNPVVCSAGDSELNCDSGTVDFDPKIAMSSFVTSAMNFLMFLVKSLIVNLQSTFCIILILLDLGSLVVFAGSVLNSLK